MRGGENLSDSQLSGKFAVTQGTNEQPGQRTILVSLKLLHMETQGGEDDCSSL